MLWSQKRQSIIREIKKSCATRKFRPQTKKFCLTPLKPMKLWKTEVTVQEHTIVVDGSELSERKELEFVVDGNSEGQSTIKHTRKIDGQVADEQVTSEKKQVTEELNYSNAEVDAVYDCEVIKQPITSTPSLPKLVIFEPPDDEEDEESNEMEAHYGTRNEGFYVLPKCKCRRQFYSEIRTKRRLVLHSASGEMHIVVVAKSVLPPPPVE